MNIIQPYTKLFLMEGEGVAKLRRIEYAARVSHRSEEKQTHDSWHKFLTSVVLNHGDWSVTEHESVSVEVVCDRGISHEWVRHRIGAYTQESTRFVNYAKGDGAKYIVPVGLEGINITLWQTAIETADEQYQALVGNGVAPQIARSVFPTALATKLIVTYNLRNWRHFLIMRTTKESHPQMRELTIPLLKKFQEQIPLLYDDIVPEERQAVALSKAR